MNWNIITDSSCDLLPSASTDGRIRLTSVPFTIRIGERDFVDDEHLDTMEMLSAMEQERSASHTSCPTPEAWLAQFEQADCAIAITISSQLSGSMNSALAARDMALEKNPDVRIVAAAVSLESVAELTACMEAFPELEWETVCLFVARPREAGHYHLFSGQNPVYLFTMQARSGTE